MAEIAQARSPEKLHRRRYTRRKPIPRKPSRLDPFTDEIKVWLSVDASLTGLEVHDRLVVQHGQTVSTRTVQRLVKKLRTELLTAEIAESSQMIEDAA
ncbi:hypothetical protein [Tranquillimonas rosea]|uniref:hypothetical protein n=1 Tax=Tranquillimonas rosea TaxID=641238 RepID=UPI003BA9E788